MNTIRVVDFLGTPCLLASEKGTILASELKRLLQQYKEVTVDFTGYEFLSSAFLNRAFGQLSIDLNLDPGRFHERVHILGLQEDDLDEVRLSIDNADTRRLLISKGENPDHYFSSRLPA
jgi:hypothetical protein